MPDLVPSPSKVRRPSRWGRWFRAIEFAVQLTLAVGYVLYAFHYAEMTMRLRSTLAEMDRDHPGWRLEDIESRGESVPDAENSALRITELDALLPEHWIGEDLAGQIEGLPPQTQLSPDQFNGLRKALDGVRPALEVAHKLADLPKGRYPIVHRPDRSDPSLTHAGGAMRKTARLVRFDSIADLQAGDARAAVRSARAALNVGRSIGDEPGSLPSLVRVAMVSIASNNVKRLLAQSEPDDSELEMVQAELEAEEQHPYWPVSWRGERALGALALTAIMNGDLDLLDAQPGSPPPSLTDRTLGYWYLQDRFRNWGPQFFDMYSRLEGTDEIPAQLRQPILDKMAKEVYRGTNPLLLVFPALAKIGQACTRIQATLRCHATALAAERYRRAHGDWPRSLDLLTPNLIAAVPDDPYTGDPIIYRRLADGVVIYSVGLDGIDNGGNVDAVNVSQPGTDIGIRLWEPAKRRQPPEPPAAPPNGP